MDLDTDVLNPFYSWLKEFFGPRKIFGPKKIVGSNKKFWLKKSSSKNFFWGGKVFCLKKCWVLKKCFGPKKMFGFKKLFSGPMAPEIFWVKILGGYSRFQKNMALQKLGYCYWRRGKGLIRRVRAGNLLGLVLCYYVLIFRALSCLFWLGVLFLLLLFFFFFLWGVKQIQLLVFKA